LLPADIAELVAEVLGLIEWGNEADGPWTGPGNPFGGSPPAITVSVIEDWTVPDAGPKGSVTPANYAFVSSFDIDWLNTAGFQTLLDNMAASPGAFQTVRVMKALNSGVAEIGSMLTGQPPADTVWAFAATPPVPPINFSATISALTELTKRGLTPFVVLGFFPQGVYNGTIGGLPNPAVTQSYESPPYGPSPSYMHNNKNDWGIVLQNWNKLIQEFFRALDSTFGSSIKNWWFEIWNEPDNPLFWLPDAQANNDVYVNSNALQPASTQSPLYYYLRLYQETVAAIASVGLPFQVKVGGPAIMANNLQLDSGDMSTPWSAGSQTDLEKALPLFLEFIYKHSLQCNFISLHAKGDWTEIGIPNLTQVPPAAAPSPPGPPGTLPLAPGALPPGVIYTVESAVKQFTSQVFHGYFNNIPIVNDEADMRVGASIPFYPRMTSQFPAWLTALMIANDSLTSEYAHMGGTQFMGGSDNAHLELVGYQQPTNNVSGAHAFNQLRSIMTAASPWVPGRLSAPVLPQDLVKVPVYNFYELLRLLGNEHGAFVSGQENFYPTDNTSGFFSMITVGASSGQLTHVSWVFCVYPTDPDDLPLVGTPQAPMRLTTSVEVIDLPASWSTTRVNWVQFQIGPYASGVKDVNSFTVAQIGQPHAEGAPSEGPVPNTGGQIWQYEMSTVPTQVDLSKGFNAKNIRMSQELGLVQYMPNVRLTGGAWSSPAAVDFEP